MVDHADHIAATVEREVGSLRTDVMQAEILHAGAHVGWLARHARPALAAERRSSWPLITRHAHVHHRPRGVAAVLSPANYPFLLALLPTATALAAGCTVVLKPSQLAPRSGALVADLIQAAGFPAGVVRVVQGGIDVGEDLAAAPVDVVSVTGSTRTGRRVAELAAARLTPVIAELGGADPMLVLSDADLRRAARAALWSSCFHAGQSCVSVERIYVVEGVHEEFVGRLEAALDHVDVATGDRRDIGPLMDPRHAQAVVRQIDRAVHDGALLRRGGRQVTRDGAVYVEPTLLTGVPHTTALMQDETLGPVLPVCTVADEAEAVRLANDSPYGLHASVWTADTRRGRKVAARLRAGAVAVNDCSVNYAAPGLPFGGVGASGSGRQGGVEGLRAYCFTQSVTVPWWHPPREPQWFPRLGGAPLWRLVARVLHGRRLRQVPSARAVQRPSADRRPR